MVFLAVLATVSFFPVAKCNQMKELYDSILGENVLTMMTTTTTKTMTKTTTRLAMTTTITMRTTMTTTTAITIMTTTTMSAVRK